MSNIKWSNIFKGFSMGTSDLVPGISGGTIALLLGIYNDFIRAISGLFSKHFVASIRFLIPIGLGMVLAIGSLSKLINYLLSEFHIPTMFFFTGLIIGIIPFLLKSANFKATFSIKHYLLLILGIAIILIISSLSGEESVNNSHFTLDFGLIIKYFLAGMCASSAMLLPGISGSFMLLVFGVYGTIMFAISEFVSFNFAAIPLLITVGCGVIFGFMFSSKLIQYLLSQYTITTYALIIGLVIGSLYAVFPGIPTHGLEWLISLIVLCIGVFISQKLSSE